MADPKVRINKELKEKIAKEVKENPEYSSQKSFVNKAVQRLLNEESEEVSDAQRQAIKEIVEEYLD